MSPRHVALVIFVVFASASAASLDSRYTFYYWMDKNETATASGLFRYHFRLVQMMNASLAPVDELVFQADGAPGAPSDVLSLGDVALVGNVSGIVDAVLTFNVTAPSNSSPAVVGPWISAGVNDSLAFVVDAGAAVPRIMWSIGDGLFDAVRDCLGATENATFCATQYEVLLSGLLLTGGGTESNIVQGLQTLVFEVRYADLRNSGAEFNAIRADIVNGIVSSSSQPSGWNAVVTPLLLSGLGAVARVDARTVTITLPAIPGYSIEAPETLNVTFPASAVVSPAPRATPTSPAVVSIAAEGAAFASGTVLGVSPEEVNANATYLNISLSGTSFVASISTALALEIVDGIAPTTPLQPSGWQATARVAIRNSIAASFTRVNATLVRVIVPRTPQFRIASRENINVVLPANATLLGVPLIVSPTNPTFFFNASKPLPSPPPSPPPPPLRSLSACYNYSASGCSVCLANGFVNGTIACGWCNSTTAECVPMMETAPGVYLTPCDGTSYVRQNSCPDYREPSDKGPLGLPSAVGGIKMLYILIGAGVLLLACCCLLAYAFCCGPKSKPKPKPKSKTGGAGAKAAKTGAPSSAVAARRESHVEGMDTIFDFDADSRDVHLQAV